MNITLSDISVVVAVKNNQKGIDKLLAKFEELVPQNAAPREIVIVDNNSYPPLEINSDYSFSVIHSTCRRVGPAAARNEGVSLTSGDWVLFVDSDCTPSASTINGYVTDANTHVAYAGNIAVESRNILSKYYQAQETLIPPRAIEDKIERPDYLVTANSLVLKRAFNEVDGFDESFVQAGGEDIDLGFKLLCIGSMAYQWESVVFHSFDDGLTGFWKRFKRYGVGNQMLAKKYNLDLRPRLFMPNIINPSNLGLALLQFLSMRLGYRKY